jgi:hypothetical protein
LYRSLELLDALLRYGLKVSRLDLHLDDRDKTTTPAMVWQAIDGNQMRTRARRELATSVVKCDGVQTVYLGSRRSGNLLRVYNGDNLHDAGTGTRWELETHGKRACAVAKACVSSEPAKFPEVVMGHIRGHVDFVDRAAAPEHPERAPLLNWWATLVAAAPRVVVVFGEVKEHILRKLQWLQDSVAPTLALVAYYVAGDQVAERQQNVAGWLDQLLLAGRERITELQADMLPPATRGLWAAAVQG